MATSYLDILLQNYFRILDRNTDANQITKDMENDEIIAYKLLYIYVCLYHKINVNSLEEKDIKRANNLVGLYQYQFINQGSADILIGRDNKVMESMIRKRH